MKAEELFDYTLKLLGYTDSNGNALLQQRIRNKAVVSVNTVYTDLHRIIYGNADFKPIESLNDEINLPDGTLYDVFPYGLAAQIALSENDGDQQQYFITIYNRRRACLSRIDKINDSIPKVW